MPSNVRRSRMRVPEQLRAGLTTLCVICFCGLLASAQSQTTHYQSHSSTHYSTHQRTASRVRTVEQKPHSVPSSVVPEVLGKSSGRAAVSPNKELNQLEGGSKVKSTGVKSAASPGPAKSMREPEK